MRKILIILLCLPILTKGQVLISRSDNMPVTALLALGGSGVYKFVENIAHPNAVAYYVSSSLPAASDANPGTDPNFPWRTITKVNSSVYAANDVVYFKRGDTWTGTIIANRNNISFDAYGSGALPKLSGFTTISTLFSSGGGKYYAMISGISGATMMVTLNDTVQIKSRYPAVDSVGTGLDSGWLKSNTISSSTKDSNYIVGVPTGIYHTGSFIVTKNWKYREQLGTVDSVGHDTVWYSRSTIFPNSSEFSESSPVANRYTFRMNDSVDLRRRGYWCTYGTKFMVYLPGGLGSNVIKIATVGTAFNLGARTDVQISNFQVEGYNDYGVYGNNGKRQLVQGSTISYIGGKGINIDGCQKFTATLNTISYCLQGGIQGRNTGGDTAIVTNNSLTYIGLWEGMGSRNKKDYVAISLIYRSYVYAQYNYEENIGDIGIFWAGNNVSIYRNVISKFCIILADHGAIYTFNDNSTVDYFTTFNRVISENYILYGYGSILGTGSAVRDIVGIYYDGSTKNYYCMNNIIAFQLGIGIQVNYGWNANVWGNTLYDVPVKAIYVSKLGIRAGMVSVKRNTIYSFPLTYAADNARFHIHYVDPFLNGRTMQQSIDSTLDIDSNYYNLATVQKFKAEGGEGGSVIGPGSASSFTTLANWQAYTGQDASSVGTPDYSADSARLFTNPSVNHLLVYLPWEGVRQDGARKSGSFLIPAWTFELYLYYGPLPGVETDKVNGIKYVNE